MLKWTLAGFLSFTSIVTAANDLPRTLKPHTGELLYKLNPGHHSRSPELLRFNLNPSRSQDIVQIYKPKDKSIALEMLRLEMLATGAFKFIEYNTLEDLDDEAPSEVEMDKQWHHNKIETELAWDLTRGSHQVIVAVCDSGAQNSHEDLKNNVLPGWNLVENNSDPTPTTSHGTFVAGLIAAQTNGQGGAGVAPEVKILPLRISNSKGGTTMKLITDCIRMAADWGAKVINVSFTGIDSRSVQEAGKYAHDKGALLVYAAGNHGRYRSVSSYPDYPNVLAVGGTNTSDKRWFYRKNIFFTGGSNYGQFIDIVAPGHNLYSTAIYQSETQPKYRSGSGTSYSAPIVSAVAALIYSINPSFSPKQVEKILLDSADNIGSISVFGAGRVNAYEAVRLALKSRP
jgi:subtilisin family serine protease